MRITENTPDRLILDDIPWIRGLLIIAATLYVLSMGFREMNAGRQFGAFIIAGALIVGPLFFALFVERYQILFLRAEDRITKRKRSVLGYKETSHRLSDVLKASVVTSKRTDGPDMDHKILKVSDGTSIRLVDYNTTSAAPSIVAKAINDWLAQADPVDTRPKDP